MKLEARLLTVLREFVTDRGYTLDESGNATLEIPLAHNNTLAVPIAELLAETPCTR